MAKVTRKQIDEAIANFKYEGILIADRAYGSGHINDTFLLIFDHGEDSLWKFPNATALS